jgi:hypothetical protein
LLASAPIVASPTPSPPTEAFIPSTDGASQPAPAPTTQASRPPDPVASIAPTLAQPTGGTKSTPSANLPAAAEQVIGTRIQGKIPAPRINVGDEWEYLDLVTDPRYAVPDPVTQIVRYTAVDEVGGKPTISRSILAAPGGAPVRTDMDYLARPGLESGLGNANEISGIRKLFSFPLDGDTKWSYSYEYPRGDGTKGRADFDSKVIGWEQVTVPAGTFWALKVEQRGWGYNLSTTSTSRQPSRQTVTLWFSPEVKHSVKVIFQVYCYVQSACVMQSVRTWELIRFTTAAPRGVARKTATE